MRWAWLVVLAGCATQQWTTPQPYFKTREPAGVFQRAVEATKQHCGGVRTVNEESGVVVGPWVAWNTGQGLVLTQCLVSLMRGDELVVDVRVTFAARTCPLTDMDDLEAVAKTCEFAETVPEQVKNGLVDVSAALEAAIKR
jgi:hypothetical protein